MITDFFFTTEIHSKRKRTSLDSTLNLGEEVESYEYWVHILDKSLKRDRILSKWESVWNVQ